MNAETEFSLDEILDDLENTVRAPRPEKDILAMLLIDKSSSMASTTTDGSGKSRPRIDGACDGIRSVIDYATGIAVLKNSLLFSVGWFGDYIDCTPFQRVDQLQPPKLQAGGGTPLGGGLTMALDAIQAIVCKLDDEERRFSIPNLCIVSDGAPNGGSDQDAAIKRAAQLVQNGDLNITLIGIDQSDCDRLNALGLPGNSFCVSKVSWEDAISAGTLGGGGTARTAGN